MLMGWIRCPSRTGRNIRPGNPIEWGWRVKGIVCFGLLTAALPLFAADREIDYQRDVKPILHSRCYACHGALKQEAGLRLDSGVAIREGGESGPAIVVGKAAASLIVERVSSADADHRMPPQGKPLTAEQVQAIKHWITQGAQSPSAERPETDPTTLLLVRLRKRVSTLRGFGHRATAEPTGSPGQSTNGCHLSWGSMLATSTQTVTWISSPRRRVLPAPGCCLIWMAAARNGKDNRCERSPPIQYVAGSPNFRSGPFRRRTYA